MFKRAPIIVVGIIVVLLLVSPFAIGMFTENGFRQRIETENGNPYLSTSIESYERGWFTSRVRLNYGLSDNYLTQLKALGAAFPVDTLGGFSLPVVVDIAHGPILLKNGFAIGSSAIDARIDPDSPVVTMAEQFLGLPYLIELHGRSGFGTGFKFEGDVPPAKGALGDFDYDFSGIDFSGLLKGNDLQYDAMLASLSVQSPFASAILESLAVMGDYERQPGTVSLGGGEISIAQLTATNPLLGGAPMFMAEDASVSGNVSENDAGTHLDLKAAYRFGHLAVGDEFEVSDAALGVNLNHIDNEAVRRFYSLVTDAPAGIDESQMSALMLPILQDVLAGDPSLSLDPLEFSMPEGDFNGRVNLTIDSSALPAGQAPNLQNPAALMGALNTEIDLTAAKPVAERIGALFAQQNLPAIGPDGQPLPEEQRDAAARAQAGQMLQFLSSQGLIVDNGDTYSTSIRFANGAATANGQPIPFGF